MQKSGRYILFIVSLIAISQLSFAQNPGPQNKEAACHVISKFIADVDSTCIKYANDTNARDERMGMLQEDWQKDLASALGVDSLTLIMDYGDVFMAGTNFRAWSNKIIWGLNIEFWRSQTETMNTWKNNRQEALDKLRSFCGK